MYCHNKLAPAEIHCCMMISFCYSALSAKLDTDNSRLVPILRSSHTLPAIITKVGGKNVRTHGMCPISNETEKEDTLRARRFSRRTLKKESQM